MPLPQPFKQFDIVHDFNGMLPTVGDDGFMVEVSVPRAENIGPGDDSRCNDMVIVRVVRHYPNNVLLPHFYACSNGLKDCDSALNLPVVKPMNAPQPGIAKHPA
ncbi:MAG: hypothetical protein ABR915_07955 [Thermoguttaceae bacterium]